MTTIRHDVTRSISPDIRFAQLMDGCFRSGSEIGRRLDEVLWRLSQVTQAAPTPHGVTHLKAKSIVDGLGATTIPSPIVPGSAGAVGDSLLGFATANHEHPAPTFPVVKETEIDFGAVALPEKVFTILDATVAPASKVFALHSGKAAAGKDADEAEFDAIDFRCEPLAGSFRLYATSLLGPVLGTFKVDYVVG